MLWSVNVEAGVRCVGAESDDTRTGMPWGWLGILFYGLERMRSQLSREVSECWRWWCHCKPFDVSVFAGVALRRGYT